MVNEPEGIATIPAGTAVAGGLLTAAGSTNEDRQSIAAPTVQKTCPDRRILSLLTIGRKGILFDFHELPGKQTAETRKGSLLTWAQAHRRLSARLILWGFYGNVP
jgi:hypothetical protein